jgi:hypothetical protein
VRAGAAAPCAGGTLLLVQSSICGEQATLAQLEAAGLRAERVAVVRGPLGPLLVLAGRASRVASPRPSPGRAATA